MRRRAACSRRSARRAQYNQNFLTFNSLNSYILKGDARAGHGAHLRDADGARPRDEPDAHVRPCGARGAHLGRRPDLSLPAAARGALPRRHARSPRTTSPSRSTLLKDKGHPIIAQLTARLRRRRGRGRRDRGRALRAEARARRAAVRRRPADLLARLLRDAAISTRSTLERAARLRALQGRPLRGRPLHRIRAREGLVGRRPAGRARAEQFRHRALRVLSRPRRRLRGLHRARTICSARSSPRASGRRATISPRSRTAASSSAMLPDDTPSGGQGWFINTRREKFKNPTLREALDLRLRFRMDQQDHHVRRLRAHASRCSRIPT